VRILFIGCVKFSYHTLQHLLNIQYSNVEVVGIVTKENSPSNSDFQSLEPLAVEYNIPYFFAQKNDQNSMLEWINKLSIDVIYCFGWSYLLKNQILNSSKMGVIGYHPTPLPKNRGRNPIIWALALGLEETASTFFLMDEGADSGDIISQRTVIIKEEDNARTLYDKLTQVALEQISEFTFQLVNHQLTRTPQDHAKANYWRKRSKRDGEIDWRMSSTSIYNLIRALTYPYPGAHFTTNGDEVKVWRAELASARNMDNYEPGKIIKVEGARITIKCGEGTIVLLEHELKQIPREGSYL